MIPAHTIRIHVWKPAIVAGTSYTPRGSLVDDQVIARVATGGYTHTLQAAGGAWSANLKLTGNRAYIDEWYLNGLGRHVETFSPAGELVFAGFVNTLNVQGGTHSGRIGPLLELANRVEVQYTPIVNATTSPVRTGPQRSTVITQDTTSQSLYGLFDQVVAGGELLDDGTTNLATQYRNLYLYENAYPQHSEQLDLERSAEASVELEILGYGQMFDAYLYTDAVAGTVTVSTKLGYILTADPNNVFSTATTGIATNATLAPRWDDKGHTGLTAIQELVKVGDVGSNRYIWRVDGEDLTFYYEVAPTTPAYEHRILARVPEVRLYGTSSQVYPWEVKAGRVVFLSDYLLGQSIPTDRRRDPRSVFIESVTYTYPWGLSITGAQQFKLPQFLANVRG